MQRGFEIIISPLDVFYSKNGTFPLGLHGSEHQRGPAAQIPGVMEEINKYGLQLAGVLPQDDTVYTYDCEGKPSSQVPDTAPVKKALAAIMQELKM